MSFPRIITYHTSDFLFFFFGNPIPPFSPITLLSTFKTHERWHNVLLRQALRHITNHAIHVFHTELFYVVHPIPSHPCHKTTTTSRCSDIPTYLYPYISGTYYESSDVPSLPSPLSPNSQLDPPTGPSAFHLAFGRMYWNITRCYGFMFELASIISRVFSRLSNKV